MLVLTRKAGEQVLVGDGIRITVVSVSGDKARVGIVAPEDVPIMRTEIAGTDFAALAKRINAVNAAVQAGAHPAQAGYQVQRLGPDGWRPVGPKETWFHLPEWAWDLVRLLNREMTGDYRVVDRQGREVPA